MSVRLNIRFNFLLYACAAASTFCFFALSLVYPFLITYLFINKLIGILSKGFSSNRMFFWCPLSFHCFFRPKRYFPSWHDLHSLFNQTISLLIFGRADDLAILIFKTNQKRDRKKSSFLLSGCFRPTLSVASGRDRFNRTSQTKVNGFRNFFEITRKLLTWVSFVSRVSTWMLRHSHTYNV